MDVVDFACLLPPRTGLWEPRSFHTDTGGYLLRQYQTSRGVTNRRYITSWDENGLPQLHRKRASLLLQPCWIRTNELQASVCRIVHVIVFPSLLVLWLDITFSQILARETGHSHQTVWQIEISSAQGSMGIPRLPWPSIEKLKREGFDRSTSWFTVSKAFFNSWLPGAWKNSLLNWQINQMSNGGKLGHPYVI